MKEHTIKLSADLGLLLDILPHVILFLDPEGRVISANRAAEQAFGKQKDRLTAMYFGEAFSCISALKSPGCGRAAECGTCPVRCRVQKTLQTGEPICGEEACLTVRAGDGEKNLHFLISTVSARTDRKNGVMISITDITDLKAKEYQIGILNRFLATLSDGTYRFDADNRFAYVNETDAAMLGYSQAELAKMSVFDINPYATPELMEQIWGLLRTQGQVSLETIQRCHNGSEIQVKTNAVYVQHGGREYCCGFVKDVAELKRAEEELEASDDRFRSASMGVYIQAEGKFVFVNDAFLDIIGGKQGADLLGTDFMAIIAPEYRTLVRDRIRFQAETGKAAPLKEMEYIRLDGSRVPVETIAIKIKFKDKAANLILVHDISERKKAREAVAVSEEKFKKVFMLSPDAILVTHLDDGRIIDANDAGTRGFGYRREEMIGHTVEELGIWVNPDERKKYLDILASEGRVREFETVLRSGSGRLIDAMLSAETIMLQGRKCILNYGVDVTDQKAAYRKIEASEREIREFSSRLMLAREEEGKKIARELHDELGQILTALRMDTVWVMKHRGSGSPAVGKKLKTMVEFIDGTIKTVQRISSNLRPGILDDLGLVSAIEWQAEEFEKRYGIPCSVVSEEIDLDDENRSTTLFRIVQESLTNIARHAGATKAAIRLLRENNAVVLEIKDNGRGITPGQINDRNSLGMIGIRERIKYLDGEMEITGKKGKGTTVRIVVPEKNGRKAGGTA